MSTDLKRLGFVQSSTSLAYTEAEKLYRTLRSYAPQFVASSLEKVEGQVTATAAPYVTIAQDRCDQLLKMADSRVDTLVNTADKTISRSKSGVSLRLQAVRDNVQAASDSYLQLVSKAADYVVDKLHVKGVQAATLKAVEAARDSLQSAVATAREATSDPDAAVRIASDAWANFAALPAVHKLLDTAAPATKIGVLAFNTLHDNLVSNRAYKMVVDSTAGTLTFATSTTPYKLGAHYVYPLFQPYADPAIAKVTHSKVINDVFEYWKPAATAAITAH